MKRIQFKNLFALSFIILMLSSCSMYKAGKEKYNHQYLNTESLRVAYYQSMLDTLRLDRLNPERKTELGAAQRTAFLVSSTTDYGDFTETESVFNQMIMDYEANINSSGMNGLLAKNKCCTLNEDPCLSYCKCFFLSTELKKIFSHEKLDDLTIADPDSPDTPITSIKKETEVIVGNQWIYDIDLNELEKERAYLLQFNPIRNNLILEYSVIITTY